MNWRCTPCSPCSTPILSCSTHPRARASIWAACSAQPKHPASLIYALAQYLLPVLRRVVQRAWVETKHHGSYFIRGKEASALFSRRTGINFSVAVLLFKTSQIFQKQQGREAQTYRGRDQLPPHVPKYNCTQKGEHGNNKHIHSSNLASHWQPRHLHLSIHSHLPCHNQIAIPPTSICTQKTWTEEIQNEAMTVKMKFTVLIMMPFCSHKSENDLTSDHKNDD